MTAIRPSLKHLPFGGALAVPSEIMIEKINSVLDDIKIHDILTDVTIHDRFCGLFRQWIGNSQYNLFRNLEDFPVACYSNGTSESFDKFYMKNHNRRFRCFRGEYMYHAATWKLIAPDWCYLDQGKLAANDAVVVSMPFADTGNVHPDMDHLLASCQRLGVPVLIDCAFFGTCHDIEFDFSCAAITDVVFSLSKSFPVSHARIGMRLTRIDDDDSLLIHHKTAYVNRLGAAIGISMMNLFSADYNYLTWKPSQKIICDRLGIETSNTVLFGVDAESRYRQYNRGNSTNRLCISKYLENGLPEDLTPSMT